MPVFVPAAELDKAKQEAAAAKAAQTAEVKAEEAKAETYRSQYPGSLHFDYTWDAKEGQGAWACSRSGMTTSSPTCAASSRRRPRSTS